MRATLTVALIFCPKTLGGQDMKKKLLTLLLIAAAATAGALAIAGCNGGDGTDDGGDAHTVHTYNKQVAESKYLKSEATCTQKAVYYYSCECGETGTVTFEHGDFGHKFVEGICSVCQKPQPTEGLIFTLNSQGTGYVLSGKGTATTTEIVIPSEYNNKPVTRIGWYAFKYCRELTSIIIPDSVTSIGYAAFGGCRVLTSVTIPESVTSIANGAFAGCSGLTNLTVEKGNAAYKSENNCILSKDGKTLIAGCKTSVIPDGVTNIASSAFNGCSGLTSITIPESVTSIAEYAFSDCSGLTSITIPDNVTSLGLGAFADCGELTVYCEAESKPEGWNDGWNYSNCPVVWGYKG